MRTRHLALAAVAALAVMAAPASAATKKPVYVSLGDSLAWSYTKNPDGTVSQTRKGYTELVASAAKKRKKYGKRLTVKKFGCPGEDTSSYLGLRARLVGTAIPCTFKKNQHADALAYIKKNRKRLGFISISIGANNFTPCTAGGVDLPCVQRGTGALGDHLPKIYRELRKAAGRSVPIVGVGFYNPYAAQWLQGGDYQQIALLTVDLARSISFTVRDEGAKQKVRYADVFSAFRSGEITRTTTVGGQTVPIAVAQVCALTFMCQPKPVGPDIHPNGAGYAAIAKAIRKALKI